MGPGYCYAFEAKSRGSGNVFDSDGHVGLVGVVEKLQLSSYSSLCRHLPLIAPCVCAI